MSDEEGKIVNLFDGVNKTFADLEKEEREGRCEAADFKEMLDAAIDSRDDFVELVIIARNESGSMYLASSHGPAQLRRLLGNAAWFLDSVGGDVD